MKFIFGLMLLMGIGLFLAFKYGGMLDMPSPEEQAQDLLAQIKEGMAWDQVADLKNPGKIALSDFDRRTGHESKMDYDRDLVSRLVQNNKCPEGFIFFYDFVAVAFQVHFDPVGAHTVVYHEKTMKDLLEGNLYTPQ